MASRIGDFLHLAGKVAIVTGSSAGIGEAIALEFARQGCRLSLCGRDKDRLQAVADKCQEICAETSKVHTILGDITQPDIQEKIISSTVETFGQLDILVNNVGANIAQTVQTTGRDNYHTLMGLNTESIFFLTQQALPHLTKVKGNVVNISSIVSEQPAHNSVTYSMSKAALDSFTKCLAMEMAPQGVRVNSVNPGSVVSRLYRRGEHAMDDQRYAKFVNDQSSPSIHPLGRMVKAEEVADAVVFLASSRSSFVTGQIMFVDGGRHCVCPQPKV